MSRLRSRYGKLLTWLSFPVVVAALLEEDARREAPVGRRRLLALALKSTTTSHRVRTASHYYEHLTMLRHLLAVDPAQPGSVVECGCFKGGSTVNLSLGCALVGREIHVFDSFAGLPEPEAGDSSHALLDRPVVHAYSAGMYAGGLDEVRGSVARHGAIEACHFHPGFYSETMPGFDLDCVLAFVDVDLRNSLEDCVRAIWPRLADGSTLFIHEAAHRDMVDLFYDEEWWARELGTRPPGLIGAGTGLGLMPRDGMWRSDLAYTLKNPQVDTYETQSG